MSCVLDQHDDTVRRLENDFEVETLGMPFSIESSIRRWIDRWSGDAQAFKCRKFRCSKGKSMPVRRYAPSTVPAGLQTGDLAKPLPCVYPIHDIGMPLRIERQDIE